MAVEPDISLAVGRPGGQQVAQGAASDPLGLMDQYVHLGTALTQQQILQQTFQARQRASEILAASPDLETGIQNVLRDPVASFGSGETINQFRQGMLALTQQQGEVQRQAQSGLGPLLQGLNGAIEDPSAFQPIRNAFLSTISPQARPQVEAAVNSLQGYLAGSSSPDQYRMRLGSLLLGAGVSPETLRATTGTIAPGLERGPFGQGGAETLAPVGGPAYGGGPLLGGGGGNALGVPGPAPAPGGPVGAGAGAGAAPQGPSLTSQKFMQDRGSAIAADIAGLDERVQTGGTVMQTINEAREAAQLARPGGGAEVYQRLGQLAQAFGVPQATVDKIANGDLAASQEFQKLMVNTTMSQIQNQIPAGSRLSQQEFKVFNQNNPNLSTDPRAIDKIFGFWTRVYNRDVQQQAAFNAFRKQPGADIQDFPAYWTKYQLDQGIIKRATELQGSQSPAGTVPPGAVHWVIQNGKLVPAGGSPTARPAPPAGGPQPAGTTDQF